MASFDLRCDACEHEFERFVPGFLKEEHKVCPACQSTQITQLFTGFYASTAGCSTTSGSRFT